jgi:hypothetical protein
VLGFFAKLYPRVLGLTAMPNPSVIFIITLNLNDPSLIGSGYNIKPNSFGCESGCKVMS